MSPENISYPSISVKYLSQILLPDFLSFKLSPFTSIYQLSCPSFICPLSNSFISSSNSLLLKESFFASSGNFSLCYIIQQSKLVQVPQKFLKLKERKNWTLEEFHDFVILPLERKFGKEFLRTVRKFDVNEEGKGIYVAVDMNMKIYDFVKEMERYCEARRSKPVNCFIFANFLSTKAVDLWNMDAKAIKDAASRDKQVEEKIACFREKIVLFQDVSAVQPFLNKGLSELNAIYKSRNYTMMATESMFESLEKALVAQNFPASLKIDKAQVLEELFVQPCEVVEPVSKILSLWLMSKLEVVSMRRLKKSNETPRSTVTEYLEDANYCLNTARFALASNLPNAAINYYLEAVKFLDIANSNHSDSEKLHIQTYVEIYSQVGFLFADDMRLFLAEKYLLKAVRIFESSQETGSKAWQDILPKIWLNLSRSSSGIGKFQSALNQGREAYKGYLAARGLEDTETVSCMLQLAQVYYERNEFDKAVEFGRLAVTTVSKLPTSENTSELFEKCSCQLATSLTAQGNYADAERCLSANFKSKCLETHFANLLLLINYNKVEQSKEEIERISVMLEEVPDESGPKKWFLKAKFYFLKGLSQLKGSAFKAAIESFQEAISFHQQIFPKCHPALSKIYFYLGSAYEADGVSEKGDKCFEEILKMQDIAGVEVGKVAFYDSALSKLNKNNTLEDNSVSANGM